MKGGDHNALNFDVSKYILAHFDQPISPHKLQKLTYLSQGWSLALTGQPIFPTGCMHPQII